MSLCFSRRDEFETRLSEYQAEVDQFREKEVPRQLEDIKTILTQLNKLSESLETAKSEAMVWIIQFQSRTFKNVESLSL